MPLPRPATTADAPTTDAPALGPGRPYRIRPPPPRTPPPTSTPGQPLTHDEALLSRDIHLLQDGVSSGRTLDLASSLDVGSAAPQASGDAPPDDYNLRYVLTITFQFPYETHLQDSVATMAHQYVCSVVSTVQRVSMAISPSESGLNAGQRMLSGFPEAATLARWVCQSYHYHLGVETLFASGGIDHHSSL
ncbi:Homeobox-leucine zipper protein REVOLUTA [Zea mays]|uniref:Homeobox-leucine zipper protein REVOLUTA n=1 Tax=Zea mays TaxID=4577 RepID=A0A1D6PVW2_MAIZE|nr:Homeobox-leucine zipper protein REVOLUTA [Zea mays]